MTTRCIELKGTRPGRGSPSWPDCCMPKSTHPGLYRIGQRQGPVFQVQARPGSHSLGKLFSIQDELAYGFGTVKRG